MTWHFLTLHIMRSPTWHLAFPDLTHHEKSHFTSGIIGLFQVIVLQVGTNNHGHTAEQVVGGILEIAKTIAEKQPQSQLIVMVWTDMLPVSTILVLVWIDWYWKMISFWPADTHICQSVKPFKKRNSRIWCQLVPFLQGIPPRGQFNNPLREKIAIVNKSLSDQLSGYPSAQFLNVDPALFVSAQDGSINHRDMHDYLHFTKEGYQKLVEPLLDEVQVLLKNFLTADTISSGDPEN